MPYQKTFETSFKPGFIFGKDINTQLSSDAKVKDCLALVGRKDVNSHDAFKSGSRSSVLLPCPEDQHPAWGLDLASYHKMSHKPSGFSFGKGGPKVKLFNFSKFIEELSASAHASGRTLRVLDIGAGPGVQWKSLVNSPGLELHLHTLTDAIDPALSSLVHVCTLEELPKHFAPDYKFDVVSMNEGTRGQPLLGIEVAAHLLKKDGHLLFTNSSEIDLTTKPTSYPLEEKLKGFFHGHPQSNPWQELTPTQCNGFHLIRV